MVYDEKKNKILIVIPAYNEEGNIKNLISGIRNLYTLVDILVVNDGSMDNTVQVAKDAKAKVISLPFNMGYGVALQTGFEYAIDNKYDYVIHLDADGQHDPESIASLLNEIKKNQADIIIGSRFLENSRYPIGTIRKIGIVIFRLIARVSMKQRITDPTSGFQALNRKACNFYLQIYPTDFPDVDVIISSHLAGFKIKEIPVRMHPKPFGKSMHSGLKPFYYVYKMFLSIFVTLLRKRPDKSDYLKNRIKDKEG